MKNNIIKFYVEKRRRMTIKDKVVSFFLNYFWSIYLVFAIALCLVTLRYLGSS